MPEEAKPTTVPQVARQVGEIHGDWSWVEPSVWTERMLTVLETGVKGAYFAEHGLFSLVAAYEQLVNPRGGKTTDRRAVCGRTARTVRREG